MGENREGGGGGKGKNGSFGQGKLAPPFNYDFLIFFTMIIEIEDEIQCEIPS